MRRKLISYDAFDKIEKGSTSNAVAELIGAEDILADVLEVNYVELYSYDEGNVYYETDEGTYVHATYELDDKNIRLNNVEEVVIDEESLNASRRGVVAEMLEALWNEDEGRAVDHFRSYTEIYMPKMMKNKGMKNMMSKRVSNDKSNMKEAVGLEIHGSTVDKKRRLAAIKGHRGNPSSYAAGQRKRRISLKKHKSALASGGRKAALKRAAGLRGAGGGKRVRLAAHRESKMREWANTANHVLEYGDHMAKAPIIEQVHVNRDDLGNVTAVSIPTSAIRNEGKLLSLRWDTLKTDVQVLREKGQRVWLEANFQELVSQIKRLNNLADQDSLTEALDQLVTQYPVVLYLTQSELAEVVAEALKAKNAKNYDDQVCEFIAEGILRVAFKAYPERVNKLASLANAPHVNEDEDAYEVLQAALVSFFPSVDKQMACEMQVFEDLHTVLSEMRGAALEDDADDVRVEATKMIGTIEQIINGEVRPQLAIAEDIAAFVSVIVETNLSMKPWNVVKTPYRTTVGEHPDMAKKAAHPYAPSKDFSGDWGGTLPVSDGKNYKGGDEEKMRNRSWGNCGGDDTYPSLENPYVPSGGDNTWTLKYEPGVDKTSSASSGQWSSGDTWPSLQNPYVPSAVKKHVNSQNKVDDIESRVGLKQASDLSQKISG